MAAFGYCNHCGRHVDHDKDCPSYNPAILRNSGIEDALRREVEELKTRAAQLDKELFDRNMRCVELRTRVEKLEQCENAIKTFLGAMKYKRNVPPEFIGVVEDEFWDLLA